MLVTRIGKISSNIEIFLEKLKQSDLYPSLSEFEINVVNFSENLSEDDHNVVNEMLNKNKTIICLENAKKEHFPTNALLASDSEFCIIKSEANGRRQHLLLLGQVEQAPEFQDARANDEGKIEENKKAERIQTISQQQNNETPTIAEVDSAIDVQKALDWLGTLSIKSNDDMQLINASLARGSVTINPRNYISDMNGEPTKASLYASFDVELAAVVLPKRNKILKMTSALTYVRIEKMSKDNEDDRGDGTYEGSVILYPGDKYIFAERSSVQLPEGWRTIKIAPETLNNANTYTRTTGWTIGAEGGGEISENPKVTAKLSASYSDSKSYSETFTDFTAINESSNGYCYWRYVYTKVKDNWKDIFSNWVADIENFPNLAKSTMYMKNEVVYEAPQTEASWQQFYTIISHETMYAHSHFPTYGIKYQWANNVWRNFWVNMDLVAFPEKV